MARYNVWLDGGLVCEPTPRIPDLAGDFEVALTRTSVFVGEPPHELLEDHGAGVLCVRTITKPGNNGSRFCIILVGVLFEVDADRVRREQQRGHLFEQLAILALDVSALLLRIRRDAPNPEFCETIADTHRIAVEVRNAAQLVLDGSFYHFPSPSHVAYSRRRFRRKPKPAVHLTHVATIFRAASGRAGCKPADPITLSNGTITGGRIIVD